tara:strand:+ start:797 stop:1759 length:963 start_codon:yes stop_codon:yes gene_type:complete
MSKDETGLLDWVFSPYDLSLEIICQPDVSGGLHGAYFLICSTETAKAEVFFQVTGETAPYTPRTSYTQVDVVISPNETAINIASRIKTEFDALVASDPNFTFVTTVNGTGKVNVTNMRSAANAVDGDTDFSFNNTKSFSGEQQMFSDDSGVLSFQPIIYDNYYTGTIEFRDTNIFIPEASRQIGAFSKSIGLTVPPVIDPMIAINGSIYNASDKDAFRKYTGVISGQGDVEVGILCATVNCAVEESGKKGSSKSSSSLLSLQKIGSKDISLTMGKTYCFDITDSYFFTEKDIVMPYIKLKTGESGIAYLTSRLLINKFKN